MFVSEETTLHIMPGRPSQCPECGYFCHPKNTRCPSCGRSLVEDTLSITMPLDRTPTQTPGRNNGSAVLEQDASVMLQVLPSGVCLTLSLDHPTVLGRQDHGHASAVLDLTPLNAMPHGVSRIHCRLERHGRRLMVTDLDSANGTYLNNQRLTPHVPVMVAHGDKLILGTFHMSVFFTS